MRNTLSEIPTIAYTLSSSIILGTFTIIIKVARFPVNIRILHGQKQLIKISSFIRSQMCLYLIPSPQFWSSDVLVWSTLNIKCYLQTLAELTLKLQIDTCEAKRRTTCSFSVFSTEFWFRCSVTYHLAEHWHFIVYNCKDTYL